MQEWRHGTLTPSLKKAQLEDELGFSLFDSFCCRSLLLIFRLSDRLHLHRLPIALAQTHRDSLAFIYLQKLGIVVCVTVHAFPCQQRIVSGRNAAQAEASTLVAGRLVIAI